MPDAPPRRPLVKMFAHLEMMRPYTLAYPALLTVAGAELASAGQAAPLRVALAGGVTACGWLAGQYAGDYYDRTIDAGSKPSRPIPSGRVSPREAFLTMLALIAIGYAAALALGMANLVLAVATTALGIAYSKVFKGRALLGNLDRGVLGACAVAFGGLAAGNFGQWSVLLLMAITLVHDAATNLVGTIRDVDGDRAAGCATVPVVYGLASAVRLAVGLALAWIVLGLLLLAGLDPAPLALVFYGLALVVAAPVYQSLWTARQAATRALALRAHKRLVAERLLLAGAFVAVYAPWLAALLLLVLLPASLGLQAVLRDRYEEQRPLRVGSLVGG